MSREMTFLAPRSTSISTSRCPTKPVPPVTTQTFGTGGRGFDWMPPAVMGTTAGARSGAMAAQVARSGRAAKGTRRCCNSASLQSSAAAHSCKKAADKADTLSYLYTYIYMIRDLQLDGVGRCPSGLSLPNTRRRGRPRRPRAPRARRRP